MRLTLLVLAGLNILSLLWLLLVPSPDVPSGTLPPGMPEVALLNVDRQPLPLLAPAATPASPVVDDWVSRDDAVNVADESSVDTSVMPEAPPSEAPIVASGYCALLGPLAEGDEGRLRERLAAHISAELVSYEVDVVTMHRVHIAAGGREQAQYQQAQLQERFAESGEELSSFIIGTGELSGHLSLGVFRQEQNARQWRQRIESMGFPAEVHDVVEQQTQSWLRVVLAEGEERPVISASALAAVSQSLRYEENLCETIAPR